MDHTLIEAHFPDLTSKQKEQFAQFGPLFTDWNNKINCVSRKDIDQLYINHVLHSLGIAMVMPFADGSKVLDIGTGGGFPGIPLAILYPEVHFHMIDSIGKKIKVVNDIIDQLGLKNASAEQQRAENHKGKYDFIVSRAVTRLAGFLPWTKGKFLDRHLNPFPNGILYLKGGDLREEIKESKMEVDEYQLSNYFSNEFFETKKVIYVRMK
ncbi:MAG: 16S rRNA (guanine(527)-N(7))-methyltransferase RsmG [Flavobacteriales bacterium]|nr:16S rRNA (guanine(527)-N(7))-methyltransferase RsmG [Flavobacteriales bacterium]